LSASAAARPGAARLHELAYDLRPGVLGALVGWTFVAGALSLAPSWYMAEVYSRVVDSRNVGTLAFLTVAVLGLIVVLELVEWHRAETLRDAAGELDRALAPRVFRAGFEVAAREGAPAATRALENLRTVRGFLASPGLTALLDLPVALLFLAVMWLIHPWLCVLALVAAIWQAAGAWALDRGTREPLKRGAQAAAAALRTADRVAEQAPTVAALSMDDALHARWRRQHETAMAEQARATALVGAQQSTSRWLQQTVGSAVLGLACWLLLQRELPGGGGMLIVASIVGGKVVSPLFQLVSHWQAVARARTAWGELRALLESAGAPREDMPLPAPRGLVSVEQLVVSAPGTGARAPLLKGLAFRLEPGETLVVVGPSGAGKTTLARALVGLAAPSAGAVRLDGADVSTWDRDQLGPHLGYLPQRVDLLDGTLADNVARFGERDDALLADAIALAGLAGTVGGWPDGVETAIGAGGAWLSGGLRQRVGLARALYGEPALLVLDEPDASLDREGEAALVQAMRAVKARGCTVVAMSHRRTIVEAADRLLVLRDGQQLAFGPRDEVLEALARAGAGGAPSGPRGPVVAAPRGRA
jgi:ATP-binding cassette subfamily C exporter for protease/lipase